MIYNLIILVIILHCVSPVLVESKICPDVPIKIILLCIGVHENTAIFYGKRNFYLELIVQVMLLQGNITFKRNV